MLKFHSPGLLQVVAHVDMNNVTPSLGQLGTEISRHSLGQHGIHIIQHKHNRPRVKYFVKQQTEILLWMIPRKST
jgi:hypothetical protein